MNAKGNRTLLRIRFIGLVIAALYLVAIGGLAQARNRNIWVTDVGEKSISISWRDVPGVAEYNVFYRIVPNGFDILVGVTSGNSFTIRGLDPYRKYAVSVQFNGGAFGTTTRTSESKKDSAPEWRPVPVTCPHLPPRVVVTGYVENTQCQMVSDIVIGKTDLAPRGFIDAVDVWSYVNGGLEVCFQNNGWLVFLDATYLRRKVMELEHYHRDGMTCGTIDRIGTVVLLERPAPPASAPLAEPPATSESPDVTLPTFEPIPLNDCQIKLVETLFLRAAPAGEIIGLVWLNSEVPVFEINGYWYKTEFEGRTGYISRYHRKVLRGGCG